MQYEITLPADYDMAIIRHRVATRGALLDQWPGLGLKAYCVRERGTDGSPVNQYAPFYLWHDLAGMNEFLFGPGFRGIITDFGRPVVAQWTGLAGLAGPDQAAPARTATRWDAPLAAESHAETVESALAETRRLAAEPGVHTTALAVDTRNWNLIRFTLWSGEAPESAGIRYRVAHLSRPDLAAVSS